MKMNLFMGLLCTSLFFSQYFAFVSAIKCYNCNSTGIDDCERGVKIVETKECDAHEVCVTYQYDVYLEDKQLGTSTSRGCEKNKNYCGTIEDLINVLVTPAVIRERKCYICDKDLCNSSSKVHTTLSMLLLAIIINVLFI